MWRNKNILEHKKLAEYNVFLDKVKYSESKIPQDYKESRVHTVFDFKYNGQHQARIEITNIPLESVYSGVFSLHELHICILLAELSVMTHWVTDISAYL